MLLFLLLLLNEGEVPKANAFLTVRLSSIEKPLGPEVCVCVYICGHKAQFVLH
jgi:hypothetical protein